MVCTLMATSFHTFMQDSHQAALQESVAAAVSSRDADLLALHHQLEENDAHFQAELDEAHTHLLDSQELQHKLEQQLRDSEAKRWACFCSNALPTHLP